jgi:Histidine kinase-like ATPase domain
MPYQTTTPTNGSHGHSRTSEKDPGEMPVTGPLSTCREGVQATRMPGSKWSASSVMPPLGALPTAAQAARGHVRSVLAAWGMNVIADTAELIVDELVANAVNASTDRDGTALYGTDGRLLVVRLCLYSDGTRLLAEVWDQAPGAPASRQSGRWDENGRGLAMITELGATWGWYPAQDAKCVWAEMPL